MKTETSITDFSLELIIEIMEWIPLTEALNLCKVLKLPIELAYQYHKLSVKVHKDFWNVCHQLRNTLNRTYFSSLLKNAGFLNIFSLNHQLIIASYIGSKDHVKTLLGIVDPSYDHNNALRLASSEGRREVVEILLKDSRVNASDCDNQAIKWAAFHGHLEVVKLLANHLELDYNQDFGPIVIINSDSETW